MGHGLEISISFTMMLLDEIVWFLLCKYVKKAIWLFVLMLKRFLNVVEC